MIFLTVAYSISRAGLEVYTTAPVEDSINNEGSESTDAYNNFNLQTGEITAIEYIGELYSDNFEQDYEDISTNASVSLPITYLEYLQKGKKAALMKGWQTSDKYKWEDQFMAVMGFITEINWTKDKVDIKITGMNKLLDLEAQFDFKQTKRSEIVKAIIEASGLKAKVDVTGLNDDVIDFTNGSSSSKSTSNENIKSTGSDSIDEAVKNAISGKTDDLSKAKSIDSAFKEHVIYDYYWDVHHPNLDEAWKNAHLNCADGANVLCAMFIAGGLNAVIVHTDGHYIVKLSIGGKTYFTDNAANSGNHTSRPFGEVWRGITSGSEVGTKIEA